MVKCLNFLFCRVNKYEVQVVLLFHSLNKTSLWEINASWSKFEVNLPQFLDNEMIKLFQYLLNKTPRGTVFLGKMARS